jgi:catechol 2,3-dioxygenase
MLPAATHIGCVRLRVAALDRSLGFYSNLLGLNVQTETNAHATLGAPGAESALLELFERRGAKQQPVRAAGLYHTAFLLPTRVDLGHALRRLADVQYPLQGGSDHAVSEALYLADPDGNGVEIYADRPRDDWPRSANGSEIAMTTLPLDVESLLVAADSDSHDRSEAWSGFPTGTVVGHVHLRVPSIDFARRLLVDVIGFDITASRYPGAIFVSAGGYHHHVAANVWDGPGIPPLPEDAAGLIDFDVIAPDAAEIELIAARASGSGLAVDMREDGIVIHDSGISVRLRSGHGVAHAAGERVREG